MRNVQNDGSLHTSPSWFHHSAVTLNDLLLCRPGSSQLPRIFSLDNYPRRRWRHVRYMIDVFGNDGLANISHLYKHAPNGMRRQEISRWGISWSCRTTWLVNSDLRALLIVQNHHVSKHLAHVMVLHDQREFAHDRSIRGSNNGIMPCRMCRLTFENCTFELPIQFPSYKLSTTPFALI